MEKKMSINCLLFLALTCQLDSLWDFMSTKNLKSFLFSFCFFFHHHQWKNIIFWLNWYKSSSFHQCFWKAEKNSQKISRVWKAKFHNLCLRFNFSFFFNHWRKYTHKKLIFMDSLKSILSYNLFEFFFSFFIRLVWGNNFQLKIFFNEIFHQQIY